MIYFDNAATSFPKAPKVGQAMAEFIAKDAANPGRAGHRMAVAAEQMIDEVRLKLSRMLNGESHERIIFTYNGTDALNIAIKGVLCKYTNQGLKPHVVTTNLEHNSVSRPLVAKRDAGKIELTMVEANDQGFVEPAAIEAAITDETKLVVMTHASNVLGTIQDAAAVGQICRDKDILFCLDVAQTVGVVPIDIEALKVDLLCFPGHKSLLGPTGTGVLYVGSRCGGPENMVPFREGGTGGDSSTPTQPELFPYYFEGGTPNTVGIAGLGAAIDYVLEKGIESTLKHEQALVAKLLERFGDDPRFTFYGPKDATKQVGTICFNVKGYDAPDIGSILDDSFEIAVRPGLHCAPYVHRQLGTFPDGAVRVSPGAFNTDADMDQLIEALDEIAG